MSTPLSLEYLCAIGLPICSPWPPVADRATASCRAMTSSIAASSVILEPSAQAPQPHVALCKSGGVVAKKAKAGTTSLAGKKLRVVALHGHAQSAEIFEGRIGALKKEVKALTEFAFLDGPYEARRPDGIENTDGAALTWAHIDPLFLMQDGSTFNWELLDIKMPSAWLGIERTVAFLQDLDCDGIVGFSFSAAMLAALLCHPECGTRLRSRLRFVAFFSGFIPPDHELRGWIEAAGLLGALPSFHCIGTSDTVIVPQRSQELAEKFEGAHRVVHMHDGGHNVASLTATAVRKEFKAFLQSLP